MSQHNTIQTLAGVALAGVTAVGGYFFAESTAEKQPPQSCAPMLQGSPEEHAAANAEPVVVKNYEEKAGGNSGEVPDEINHKAGW